MIRQNLGHVYKVVQTLLLGTLFGAWLPLFAGSGHTSIAPAYDDFSRDSVYFRAISQGSATLNCYLSYPQNGSEVLRSYGNNSYELGKLGEFIRHSLSDTSVYVRNIRLCGYSSIEGSYLSNEELAGKRSLLLRRFLLNEYPFLKRYEIITDSEGEDWKTLRSLLLNSDLDEKEDVIQIIDHIDIFEGREKQLIDLNKGRAYRNIERLFFPLLRRVEVVVEYDLQRTIEERYHRKLSESEFLILLEQEREKGRLSEARLQKELEELKALRAADSVAHSRIVFNSFKQPDRPIKPRKKMFLFGVKTNLYSLAGFTLEEGRTTFMPNLEIEVFPFPHWSLSASLLYAYRDFSQSEFWGVSAYTIEPRFWFGSNRKYHGLYMGLYGRAGDFDIRRDVQNGVTMNNRTGSYYESGITAGYALAITPRWILEAGIAGGYRHAGTKVYEVNQDKHYFIKNEAVNKLKLTEIRLNIGYRFGKLFK